MADLHHGHSDTRKRNEITLRLFEYGNGKNGWACGEIENACGSGHDNVSRSFLDRSVR